MAHLVDKENLTMMFLNLKPKIKERKKQRFVAKKSEMVVDSFTIGL